MSVSDVIHSERLPRLNLSMGRMLGGIFGALATSALLALSLPPADFGALGWACLVPLLVGVRGRGFSQGFLAAIAACMLAAWWTILGWPYTGAAFANNQDRMAGDSSWHFVGFFLLSIIIGIVAGVYAELKKLSIWTPLCLGLLGVALESATQFVLPVHLGLTQYLSMPMMQVASVAGLWGVTFLVWLANVSIAGVVAERKDVRPPRSAYVWAALSGAVWLWAWRGDYPLPGALGPAARQESLAGHREVNVAALQSRSGDLGELMSLTRTAAAWLTVWPELSGLAEVTGGDVSHLIAASKEFDRRFATSFEDDTKPKPHNALSIISPEGESNRYFKRKLFGGEADSHQPGDSPAVAVVDNVGIGLNICFDSCFGSVMIETAEVDHGRADLIVLPSMGPESPNGFIQSVHGAFIPFRSAETGLPIVRSEFSAAAMITDATGRVLAYGAPGEQGLLMARVALDKRKPPYRNFPNAVLYASWAGSALWILCAIARRPKKQAKAAEEPAS